MIQNIGGIVFATSDRESDKYIEVLRAEHNLDKYVLKIDRTLRPPQYTLFLEDEERRPDGSWRILRENLFESCKMWKIENYIKTHISL